MIAGKKLKVGFTIQEMKNSTLALGEKMVKILVTPEEVRNVATQFKQKSQQSQEMVSSLESTIGNLQAQWEGMTSQRFYQQYAEWKGTMTQFVEMLNQIGLELDAIAERFAAADQQ